MDVIILCGGVGSRLKSISGDIAKPLVPLGNSTCIDLIISALVSCGCFKRIFLASCYRAETFDAVVRRWAGSIDIANVPEAVPSGTGGAIMNIIDHLDISDEFVVCNGDTFLELDWSDLMFRHNSLSVDATMAVVLVSDTYRYGRCEFKEGNNLLSVSRGVRGEGYISTGVVVVGKESFKRLAADSKIFSFEDGFLGNALEQGTVAAVPTGGVFFDIGVPVDYFAANIWLLERDSVR